MEVIRTDRYSDVSGLIQVAVQVLSKGGVIVFPTDTLYSLMANAMDEHAVKRVFDIKQREQGRPLPIAARNMMWVRELAYVNSGQERVLESMWPGKVTAVLKKKSIISDVVTAGAKTVGIRIPAYDLIDQLLAQFGYPVTATSAHIFGKPPAQNIEEIVTDFRIHAIQPDLVIDVGTLPPSQPSTLLDLTGDHPRILRVGATTKEQLMKILHFSEL